MANVDVPAGVGWTALLTAYSRAQESAEENALFDDQLARVFIESASRQAAGPERLPRLGPAAEDDASALWDMFKFYFTQRTPFFDQQVLRAVGLGFTQVVVMGAGLDSRAFRLGLPRHIRVFELDDSRVLDFKRDVLRSRGIRPGCMRTTLAVDLAADWTAALTSAGFDPRRPAIWVVEGLLIYLSRTDADVFLDRITHLSAPGSRLAGEYVSRRFTDSDVADDTLDEQDWAAWKQAHSAFRYGPVDVAPAVWLKSHGWMPGETTTAAEIGTRHGRPLPALLNRPHAPQMLLFEGAYQPYGHERAAGRSSSRAACDW